MAEINQQKSIIFVFNESLALIRYVMKTILVNLETKETIIFSVKTDLCKHIGVSPSTLLRWSKEGIKQTKKYLICFEVKENKNRSKVRSHCF